MGARDEEVAEINLNRNEINYFAPVWHCVSVCVELMKTSYAKLPLSVCLSVCVSGRPASRAGRQVRRLTSSACVCGPPGETYLPVCVCVGARLETAHCDLLRPIERRQMAGHLTTTSGHKSSHTHRHTRRTAASSRFLPNLAKGSRR